MGEKTAAGRAVAIKTAPAVRYGKDKLRRNCVKLFNVPQSTFDGAFFGRTGPFTVEEARGILNAWLSEPAAL